MKGISIKYNNFFYCKILRILFKYVSILLDFSININFHVSTIKRIIVKFNDKKIFLYKTDMAKFY